MSKIEETLAKLEFAQIGWVIPVINATAKFLQKSLRVNFPEPYRYSAEDLKIKYYGKVVKLLPAAKHKTCENCPGELKDKPITGMIVLKDLTKTPNGASNGKAIDPSNGKTYNCFIELENPDKLKLRGYIGVPTIGRTQYWYRVK